MPERTITFTKSQVYDALKEPLTDGIKLLTPHDDDCWFKGTEREATEFVCYDGAMFNLKRNGHRGGSTMWHRFRCNDPSCGAVAIVRWDVLTDLIAKGLNDA